MPVNGCWKQHVHSRSWTRAHSGWLSWSPVCCTSVYPFLISEHSIAFYTGRSDLHSESFRRNLKDERCNLVQRWCSRSALPSPLHQRNAHLCGPALPVHGSYWQKLTPDLPPPPQSPCTGLQIQFSAQLIFHPLLRSDDGRIRQIVSISCIIDKLDYDSSQAACPSSQFLQFGFKVMLEAAWPTQWQNWSSKTLLKKLAWKYQEDRHNCAGIEIPVLIKVVFHRNDSTYHLWVRAARLCDTYVLYYAQTDGYNLLE